MPKGYNGKILRVDLSSGRMTTEEHDETWYRTYYGGRGFNAYFLMKEVGPNVDPLEPDNKLLFSLGPLTGAPISGSGRSSVGAKSPLTGGYGEGDVGGFFGAELKHAGFDAIIFEGKAERPVYLWVHDGEAELRNAAHLWGKNTLESQEAIRAELGDAHVRTALIGPAGENLVRFACVINDLKHAAGRCGMGAVMGSKRLKAVVTRGKGGPEWADSEVILKHARWLAGNFMETAGQLYNLGTANGLLSLNAAGGLPTRNFQTGVFEHAEEISGEKMRDTILVGRENCYACVIRCKRVVTVEEPWQVNPAYGGPEYETIAAFGSNCGISDLKAIAKASELCNAYSLDTISTGNVIAFAMECYEKGLLTSHDADGLELRFGNVDAMLEMVEKIARRDGLGALLGEGTARAAARIGRGAEELAMQVKGQELPMHEPRIKHGLGVGYSISPTGADHNHNIHDTTMRPGSAVMNRIRALGLNFEPLAFNDLGPDKMSFFTHWVNWCSATNCLGMCLFIPLNMPNGLKRMAEVVEGATGWSSNLFELMKVGERMNTLCQAYNIRMGLSAKDDTLPKRFFKQIGDPQRTTAPLDRKAWEEAKDFYYQSMGWTREGIPTRQKLQELGVGWAADVIGVRE